MLKIILIIAAVLGLAYIIFEIWRFEQFQRKIKKYGYMYRYMNYSDGTRKRERP